MNCTCSNCQFGFDCVVDFCRKYPGDIWFCCEICGIYQAGKARCNLCEESAE